MNGVWVWIEHRNGAIATISREVMSAGRSVANALNEPVTAVVLGQNVGDVAAAAFDLGADAVWGSDEASLAQFRVEAFGPLVAREAQARQPRAILAGASIRGRDLMSWVAADLDAGLVGDAIKIRVEGQTILVTRPVYAGKLLCDASVQDGVQLVTLRGRAFAAAESTGKSGSPEWVQPAVAEGDINSQVIGSESSEGKVSLTDAKIIVSGGRGVGGPEGFAPVRELAEVLGGALGASRATVDAGWIPYEHQVGQTGKTVSPDLYIACGISGAIQHQAGMRTSKVIVAINKDADAPIFKLAHYGITGDLFKIVPALTAEFRRRLGK